MAGGTDEASLTSQIASLTCHIGKKLQGDVSADWLSCSIFKVPNHLRRISEQAYEPQVISIGPYHHGKDQLKKMEGYKIFYLNKLVERRSETSLVRYVTFLKHKEEDARKFYSEPLDHISGEEFVEMMLLDGCFIIELIRKSAMEELRLENDHLLRHFILGRVMLDLMLVENQLPYFILSELFDMTVKQNDEAKDFMGAAINFFSRMMPGSQIGRPENQDIKHLLGLLHDSCQASSPYTPEVRISCLPEKVIGSLCPKAKLNRCSSEVVRSSPPEPLEEVRFQLPKAMAIYRSLISMLSKIGQIMQMKPPRKMAAPSVIFSSSEHSTEVMAASSVRFPVPPSKSSEEVSIPLSDTDNLRFGEAAASSTSVLQPKSPEELRFLPPKAMIIPSSSLSKSSVEEEIVPSVSIMKQSAASVSFSPLNPKMNEEKNGNSKMNEEKNGKWQFIRCSKKKKGKEKWQFIRPATELREAGIDFKKKIKGRLFDIEFDEKGVMSIPALSITDDTESILRNLVAYEQCFKGASSKCLPFTDYITFMDRLISTTKDVELLRHREVIDNWLGDDEVVAKIFNKLGDSVLISKKRFSYAETFDKVNEHCEKKWNRSKGYLWYNCVNNTWTVISVVAAVILLLVTVLQSVYSVLSFYIK